MSGHMWKQDKDGNSHPDDSDLLVYTSQQLFADSWENIQRQLAGEAWERTHQHIVRCTDCQRKCKEYTPVCATLRNNLTYQMPAYPSIVEMLGEQIDNPAAAQVALQQRRQKQGTERQKSRAIAFTSGIPVRLQLVLLAMTIVLAFTIIKYVQTIPSYSSGAGSVASPVTPVSPQPNSTSKPTPKKSAATPGTGGSEAAKPYLAVCSNRGRGGAFTSANLRS